MIYVWQTSHDINEQVSKALHAGIPNSILKHSSYIPNYRSSPNKFTSVGYGILRGTGEVFDINRKANIDWYEVDRGYINPKHFNGYYRISKNALQATYKEADLPSDRLDKLVFKREEWFNPKGRIIVCPPSEYIEGFYGLHPGSWLAQVEGFLKNNTQRKIKVRQKTDTAPLEYDLQDAYCVITFNSNVAVDAAIKGVPVITGVYSIAGKWSKNTLQHIIEDKIEVPASEHVEKFLRFVSYNQFTLDEIRKGEAWKIMST